MVGSIVAHAMFIIRSDCVQDFTTALPVFPQFLAFCRPRACSDVSAYIPAPYALPYAFLLWNTGWLR